MATPAAAVTEKASDPPKVKISVVGSMTTASQLVLDVSLPGSTYTHLISYKAPDGKTYVKVVMPGLTTSFDPTKSLTAGLGRPGIPALSIPFAIPEDADPASTGYSAVSTQILNAYYKDIKVTKDIFPASTQPLDGAPGETSISSGPLSTHCSVSSEGKLSCWGMDEYWTPGTSPDSYPNTLRDWLAQHPNLPGNVGKVSDIYWHKLAVGTTYPTGFYNTQPASNACGVAELVPNPTSATAPINSLYCFGGFQDWDYSGVGGTSDTGNSGAMPPALVDVKDVQSSLEGGAYCVLLNNGTAYIPAAQRGHGEVKCISHRFVPWSNVYTVPALKDPVSGASTYATQLSMGYGHGCALLATGRPLCFGPQWDYHSYSLPSGLPLFKKVIAGITIDCGIKAADSKLVCWGLGQEGADDLAARPLPADVAGAGIKDMSISISRVACVVKVAGQVRCFQFNDSAGSSNQGPLDVPLDIQSQAWKSVNISNGTYNVACAVSLADKVSCWGPDAYYQLLPPDSANRPVVWSDPIFDDFTPDKLYSGMPDSLVRPFVRVDDAYVAPDPVPAGSTGASGAPITGNQNLFKADQVQDDQGQPVRLRGLGLGQLYLYGGQYTASTKKLRVFSKVRVKIKFLNPKLNASGKADYGLDSVDSPWNQSFKQVYGNVLANADIALGSLTPSPVARRSHLKSLSDGSARCGEEMLVVTDPAFAAQADDFRLAKDRQGMLTKVVQVGDPSVGRTAAEIRTFVQGEFAKTEADGATPCISPSYLTLLGDATNVPTFTGDTVNPDTPGDVDYSLPSQGTYIPDLAVGRLPARDAAEAQTMVNKVIGYETAAPSSADPFYKNMTVTAFFQNADPRQPQDQRGFVRSSEQMIAALTQTGAGKPSKTAERLYSTSNPTASTKLTKDDLGRALPTVLQKTQKQPPWNSGTQTSVVNSVRAGRFLVVSRDHGGFDRIFNPAYGNFAPLGGTSAVSQMNNGAALPVAWLIACLSGRFDDPTSPSFAEDMLGHPGGGMAGVLAASRESPSEVNNSLLLALADSVWPSVLPTGSGTPVYRMGDVVNAAKLQVLMSGGPSASRDILNEMRLYNWFGDPSMQMWIQKPAALPAVVSGSPAITPRDVTLTFTTTNADQASAVLLGDGDVPIGKARVLRNSLTITPQNGIAASGSLKLVINKDQSLPTTITLRR